MASWGHKRTWRLPLGVETFRTLNAHLYLPENWIGIGRRLDDLFSDDPIKIAVTAAGAVPYYSKLPAVDMLGLTDSWIAHNGPVISDEDRASELTRPICHKSPALFYGFGVQ